MEGTRQREADPLLGAVLENRYRIERKLGQGGMGMVYLGEHVRTGRRCAVKLLPPEATHDAEAVKRFEREARVLGTLGHPGIVGIHDFSETPDGRPYFVMDYLEGEDLQTRLRRVGRLSWDETRKIVDEIAAALYAAHLAGVLHRDLKPANVFLTQSPGAPERVVLLDFGLAKGGITESVALTRSNMIMGTPLYMSPEQAHGADVDARSDIYSLAALTYELLAGQPPFVGPNYTAVLASLLTDPPRKLSESAQVKMPAHLDLVLDVALSKMPESRQPDVAAFAKAVLQKQPRWIDTTARRVAVAATTLGDLGEGTGLPAVRGSSMEVAATVASSPEMSGQLSLPSAATVASKAGQALAAAGPPTSVAASHREAQPLPSQAKSDLAVQQLSTPLVPVSVEAPPFGRKRSALLPVVLVMLAIGALGAVVSYWLGQRRSGASGSSGDAPLAAARPAARDAAVVNSPRVPDANVASSDAELAKQNAGKQILKVSQRAVSSAMAKVQNRARGSSTTPRPPARRRSRAMVPVRTRRRAAKRPVSRRSTSRESGNVRLGDLYIRGRYKQCLRKATRMQRTKQVLEYGYYCANKLGRTGAVKRFCRQYLRLKSTGSHANTCRHVLKRP